MSPVGRSTLFRLALPALLVAAAVALVVLFPRTPDFPPMLVAVLLAAFVCGTWAGAGALVVTMPFALGERLREGGGVLQAADLAAFAGFVLVGILFIVIVDVHHKTVARLNRERRRTEAALKAAKAAVWELSPDGLFWDDNFYRLVGLPPQSTPPSTPTFLAMIHPEDRARMAEARRLMDEGIEPRQTDEYRLTRPDGEVVWLENHRIRVSENGDGYFIGITQDITRRKLAEERVQALLREADHRAKNQFSVIMAIARETSRGADSAAFEEGFGTRLRALSRSHDLLVRGGWTGTTLRSLLAAQLEPFDAGDRYALTGPDITVPPSVAQNLGMAFHELATNAAKHGALASDAGRIRVTWEIRDGSPAPSFALTWQEEGGPPPTALGAKGFGTKVLLDLVPTMLAGEGQREFTPAGMVWTFTAPLSELLGSGNDAAADRS